MHCNILINDLIDFEILSGVLPTIAISSANNNKKLELSHLCGYHHAHLFVNIVLYKERK